MPVKRNFGTNLRVALCSSIKRKIAISIAALSMIAGLGIPSTAQAGGSLHIDIPGLSIGVHDDHYKRKRHRRVYRDRHYYDDRKSRRHYSKKRYYKDRYYDDRYYNDRKYRKRHYKKRYYNWRDDDYYYGGRSNRYRSRNRGYDYRRAEICPQAGYSPYYDDNKNCYRHKDHFHCS